MKKFIRILFVFIIILFSNNILAKNNWILDKKLSEIYFQLTLLPADDLIVRFNEFDSYIFIDNNNTLINNFNLSINIDSIELNNSKLKDFLLSNLFFNVKKYPNLIVKTEKIIIQKIENATAKIQIKNISHELPVTLEIFKLTKNLIQIKTKFVVPRKLYGLGKNQWQSKFEFFAKEKSILLDKIKFSTNLFFFKQLD